MLTPAAGYSREVMRLAAVLLVAATAAAVLPLPAALVESLYSGRVFPAVQHVLTPISNRAPFSLFDVLAVGGIGWWVARAVRDLLKRGSLGWLRVVARIGVRTVVIGAAAYLAFLATWGLNYRRVPLKDRLAFDESRLSVGAAASLAGVAVARVNALHEPSRREGWPAPDEIDPGLAAAFARAQRDLRATTLAVPARPKRTLLDAYFVRAAVAGMTDPFLLETLVASDLLPFERPFVVAHEWSHLAGLADEGDANFLGWLTCVRGSAAHQYSGWLFLYGEVAASLDPAGAAAVAAELEAGPREDLEAVRQRLLRHVSPVVQQAGWRVYDRYLKANQVAQGAASYAEVVHLVLGTPFLPDWVPVLR